MNGQNNNNNTVTDAICGRNAVRELIRSGKPVDKILVQRGEREGSIRLVVAEAVAAANQAKQAQSAAASSAAAAATSAASAATSVEGAVKYNVPQTLTDAQKKRCCELSEAAGADFVKTSTGYGTKGCTIDDLKLMRASVSDHVRVKGSGGIRDLDTVLAARAAGASRCGVSATEKIMAEAEERYREGKL